MLIKAKQEFLKIIALENSKRIYNSLVLTQSLSEVSHHKTTKKQKVINKLKYRAKQRGLLEMDLLMGKWAETHIEKMDDDMLNHFEILLNEETPELYKWITGQNLAPEKIKNNLAFKALFDDVQNKLNENIKLKSRKGSDWLRGWLDDKGNQ